MTFSHTKGENKLNITVADNCTTHSVKFNSASEKIYKNLPTGSNYDADTMNYVYFDFESGDVQNLMFSKKADPQTFIVNVEIESGSMIILKSSEDKIVKDISFTVKGNGKTYIIGVKYTTKESPKTMIYFNESLKKKNQPLGNVSDQFGQVIKGGELIKRLNRDICELCGADNKYLEIHHVRKLKDVVKKYKKRGKPMPQWVWQMSYMKRKTLVLCHDCHVKLHNGKL